MKKKIPPHLYFFYLQLWLIRTALRSLFIIFFLFICIILYYLMWFLVNVVKIDEDSILPLILQGQIRKLRTLLIHPEPFDDEYDA